MYLPTLFLSTLLSTPFAIAEIDSHEPSNVSIEFYTDQQCMHVGQYIPNLLYDTEYVFLTPMASYRLTRYPLPGEQLDFSTYADTPNSSPTPNGSACSVFVANAGEDAVLGTPGPQECVGHPGKAFVCARLWHH